MRDTQILQTGIRVIPMTIPGTAEMSATMIPAIIMITVMTSLSINKRKDIRKNMD